MWEDVEFKGLIWTAEGEYQRATIYKDHTVTVSSDDGGENEWDFAIDGNYSGYGYSTMEIAMTAALDEVDERD
jgi:hypothetical protein